MARRLPIVSEAVELTPARKVELFRGLFRGRGDVYPKLWTNKVGKTGYSPVCGNEWVRGVCEKPRIRCGDCSHQAYLRVTDRVIVDHLQGKHVIGAYAMLEDETCWFLAIDLDGDGWTGDVAALLEASRALSLRPSVERSRSGNGAHVWFFFAAPVAASTARRMGCHLLTRAMELRHELKMRSYDRLFPNQDTMPRGGFGNLIALPLQHAPRQKGNTVFLDAELRPLSDQWDHLSSLDRILPERVEEIARDAMRTGAVLGVRQSDSEEEAEDEEVVAPWMRSPSGRPRRVRIVGPLPSAVRAVLAQRLFVEKAGLPSALLTQLKRLAAFQNPEFYKRQRMRLSTALTPRVIACAEDHPNHVALPRGCCDDAKAVLTEHGVALEVQDQRHAGAPVDLRFVGQLSAMQQVAPDAALGHDTGVLVAPPGTGKTVIGAHLIARRACSTLVLVHRKPLLEQWVAQLALFLGLPPKVIGRLGAGKSTLSGKLDVAMIQSLVRKGQVDDRVAAYGHVLVDECHHLPAVSFERVLAEARARFVTGLTATPQRRDGHQRITEMQLGPVRFTVSARDQAAQRPFTQRLIVRGTSFRAPADASIQALYRAVTEDEVRNQQVLDDVMDAIHEGRFPLVLTERRQHLDRLRAQLGPLVRHVIVLRGGMSAAEQRAASDELASVPAGQSRLILATGRYVGEGFDDAPLDTLLLAMPVSWKGTLVQYAGRLHRLHPGKREVRIYDYVDRDVPVLARMFDKRLRGYRTIGYAPDEAEIEIDDRLGDGYDLEAGLGSEEEQEQEQEQEHALATKGDA